MGDDDDFDLGDIGDLDLDTRPIVDVAVVAPPTLIGWDTMRRIFDLAPSTKFSHLSAEPVYRRGYLGKIAGHHIWNAAEVLAGLYTSDRELWSITEQLRCHDPVYAVCQVRDCGAVTVIGSLCGAHLAEFAAVYDCSGRARRLALYRLVAMCRWVVERHRNLLPIDHDPFGPDCPSCGAPRAMIRDTVPGPFCGTCLDEFWSAAHRQTYHGARTRKAH